MDSDCVPNPDYINDLMHIATRPRVRSASNYDRREDRRLPELVRLVDCDHPWALMHGGNLVFPREAAARVGGFDERCGCCWGYEDVDFAWRMLTLGGCAPSYAPGIQVYHQERDADVTPLRNKRDNPNWRRGSQRIPGLREYKSHQLSQLGLEASW